MAVPLKSVHLSRSALAVGLLLAGRGGASAQEAAAPAPAPAAIATTPPPPAVDQPASGWTLHAQATEIGQGHFSFPSPYAGVNSLQADDEFERTFSFSLFLGRLLWPGAELIYNPEAFQGHGLSNTFGVAGFPNGEAVKAAFPNLHYNTSRLFLQQVIGLGGETEKVDDGQNQIAGRRDVNRLTFTVGKFAASDYFDDNAYSHDTRSQFMNWSLWESGAWDYPADVVGYTAGFVAALDTRNWALRYAILMEPTVSNGPTLDEHLDKAWGQILEYDRHYAWNGHDGTIRPFVFWNRAHMGDYQETLANPADHEDVTETAAYRSKVGAGLSWDQELTGDLGAFTRLSWNDGRTETWAFTEIDRSIAAGLSLKGTHWGRGDDTLGLAGVANGLSSEHRDYLAAGGIGMILGDGRLNYGPEEILELYYSWHVFKQLRLSPDYQYLEHPGYNRDRGGLGVYSLRAHVEL